MNPILPIEVEHLEVAVDGSQILKGLNLRVNDGEFALLTGENGSGKSILVQTLLGLRAYSKGSLQIFGTSPKEGRRRIGYHPQRKNFDPFFSATVCELIAAALRGEWPLFIPDDEHAKVEALLDQVGAQHLVHKRLSTLSVGQLQRVYLARSLAKNPELLILDEPTAGVDRKGRDEMLHLLTDINQSKKISLLVITHHVSLIRCSAHRILEMEDGRIVREEAGNA
jgi:zinc transport system ATP-binding protein